MKSLQVTNKTKDESMNPFPPRHLPPCNYNNPSMPSNLTSQVPTKKKTFITGSPVIWSKRCASMLLERFLRRSAEPCKMGSRRTWSSAVFRWILCFVLEKGSYYVLGDVPIFFGWNPVLFSRKHQGNCSFGYWKHWAEWLWEVFNFQKKWRCGPWYISTTHFLRLTTQAK